MNMTQAQAKLSRAYVAVGGTNAAANPWATIIQAFLALLAGCSTPEAKAFGKAHPLALEFMLHRRLASSLDAISARDRKLIAKAGVKAFNSASAADVDAVRP